MATYSSSMNPHTPVGEVRIYGNTTLPEGTPERPLVTFALFAYNQEHYIREAVEGALSQLYSPLEIILSDDCSHDRTFEIISAIAAAYSGPHRVITSRNSSNLNIGSHVSRIFDMARGSIIIAAAGDDVSCPERCSTIVELANKQPRAMAFCSAYQIYGSEKTVPSLPPRSVNELLSRQRWLHGATAAYRKILHHSFPPMDASVRNEDEIYCLRALLIGDTIAHTSAPLVAYRTSTGVSSSNRNAYDPRSYKHPQLPDVVAKRSMTRQWRRDLSHAGQQLHIRKLYDLRLKWTYHLGLTLNKRVSRLFHLYRRRFGTKEAIYHFLGVRTPTLLNLYLRARYRKPLDAQRQHHTT